MNNDTKAVETWEERREREKTEELTAKNASTEKIKAVIKALGYKVTRELDAEYSHVYIEARNPKGNEVISFSGEGYAMKGRISINGVFPENEGGKTRDYVFAYNESKDISISVSREKSAEAIVKDITRRLLPVYQEKLIKAHQLIEQWSTYANKKAANMKALKGSKPSEDELKRSEYSIRGAADGQAWGTVKVYDDTATIEIHSLTIEQAKKVLAVLK